MSIWGKILGGVTGFAIGGPIGAIIGTLAGHAVDSARSKGRASLGIEAKRAAFTIAFIVISAKMAKADGVVTRDEVDAFKQIFPMPPSELKGVGRLFNQARKEASGYEPYARQIAGMFRDQPAVLEELLAALFHIAKADGVVHPAERQFLNDVGEIFGFGPDAFARVSAGRTGSDKGDPYVILGVAGDATVAEIKAAWRQLTRENHPDLLVAQGMPQEFIDLANEKMATINAAYDRIARSRGFK
jgi:DnaJ like chaperone protein